MMKFNYSNTTLILNFVLAILWTSLGIDRYFGSGLKGFSDYLYLIIGLLYIAIFSYQYFRKYFEIDDDKITLLGLPSKTIFFKELVEIKYYAGDFSFKSKEKTIKISKQQMNKNELPEFEKQLEKIKNTYNF